MRSLKKTPNLCETLSVDLIVADWDGTLRPGFMLKDWLDYLASVKVIEDKYPHIFDSELHKYKTIRKATTSSPLPFSTYMLKVWLDTKKENSCLRS